MTNLEKILVKKLLKITKCISTAHADLSNVYKEIHRVSELPPDEKEFLLSCASNRMSIAKSLENDAQVLRQKYNALLDR